MATEKEEQIRDGQNAQVILENPLVVGAFNKILNEGYQQWISTKVTDQDEREALYHQQIAALNLNNLINTMENGKLLEEEVKRR